ncbi:PP2C family protein-serine/threonine phosphatase [Streptomyces cavernicola]|uniref:PP2C family protein-serine/threonine phosphatase n=1 Tax=Streptomyces cavernicola TaxID=3043613 RepID=A0ABT6SCU6_9ACTN|nr:PP2C family protein-serine/threonine phosphatase [Streptomyces sp. B-S-A6]MDI3406022.1 PP2C family protein-serine/threonine phosphatase [Streptomyces sp. B-S-A6]
MTRFVGLRRSARGGRGHALVALPIALVALVTVVDVFAPPDIHLGPLLVAAPAITAAFAGPWTTGLIAALAVAAQAVIAVLRDPDELFSANHQAQIAALILVGSCLVVFCVVRERRARELSQVRYVSEAAQRGVLRPLPKEIGPLRVASLYLAAEAEAEIGGDLYAAVRTSSGTRLIIGDVRGKGMTAVGDAALLLGAFRAAAHREATLVELVKYLDGSVCWSLSEPGETDRTGETFITAAVLDIPDEGSGISMVDCGHPPPVVRRGGGRVTTVEARQPAPPLGLGEVAHPDYHVDVFTFAVGDLLLLYTDGVIEARDSAGAFYPLVERIDGWQESSPEAFLRRLRRDLFDHVGGRLRDDVAMIAIERRPTG